MKSAIRRPNPSEEEYLASDSSKKMSFDDYMYSKMGAKKVADTVLGGYHARIIKANMPGGPITLYVWRGINIRELGEFTQANKHHYMTLESIEPNIPVPASTFEFPSGYKLDTAAQRQAAAPPQGAPRPGRQLVIPAPQAGQGGMPPKQP